MPLLQSLHHLSFCRLLDRYQGSGDQLFLSQPNQDYRYAFSVKKKNLSDNLVLDLLVHLSFACLYSMTYSDPTPPNTSSMILLPSSEFDLLHVC